MRFQLVKKSSNKKVGPIPISNSPRATCPPSCPHINDSCYAESGFHTRLNWDKVDREERGLHWGEFVTAIASLPDGQLWRHNVAGDLPGVGEEIDEVKLRELVNANKGKRGFTYTHKPLTTQNRKLLRSANLHGFTINASTDNVNQAVRLKQTTSLIPVVTLVPRSAGDWRRIDKQGVSVVRCPAEYMDTSCAECKLCASRTRAVVVGFTAHGTKAKQADIIASI
jgi:hypothetical protein